MWSVRCSRHGQTVTGARWLWHIQLLQWLIATAPTRRAHSHVHGVQASDLEQQLPEQKPTGECSQRPGESAAAEGTRARADRLGARSLWLASRRGVAD